MELSATSWLTFPVYPTHFPSSKPVGWLSVESQTYSSFFKKSFLNIQVISCKLTASRCGPQGPMNLPHFLSFCFFPKCWGPNPGLSICWRSALPLSYASSLHFIFLIQHSWCKSLITIKQGNMGGALGTRENSRNKQLKLKRDNESRWR